MIARRKLLIAAAMLAAASVARSGHELPVYPSYYPHEIEITATVPAQAAEQMRAGTLHAYIGSTPDFSGAPPMSIGFAESLGNFIILRLNPDASFAKDEAPACAAAAAIMRDMAVLGGDAGFVAHPYPVTPWHGDYLLHADLADAARARFSGGDAAPARGDLKVRAEGALAERLVRPEWRVGDGVWDAVVVEVGARELVQSSAAIMNGWLGARWTRSGWFHAHRLLSETLSEPRDKARADAALERLKSGEIEDVAERANLERDLVQALTAGCRALVAGYSTKREYYSSEFSAGIENLSYDTLEGLSSPMFLRTVKLKDFPWNGWLHLAVGSRPAAAWNPIGGFGDPFGRLMWFATGDPAAIPSPYNHTWILNRISEVQSTPPP